MEEVMYGHEERYTGQPPQGYGYGQPTSEERWHFAPPPAPKKKNKWPWVLLAVGVVLLAICGASLAAVVGGGAAVVNEINDEIGLKKQGVSLKANTCKASEFGGYDVTVTIKNTTTSKQSYWVQVDLMAPDKTTRLGEAHAVANDLAPGATTDVKTSGNGDFQKGAYCQIGDIT